MDILSEHGSWNSYGIKIIFIQYAECLNGSYYFVGHSGC